MRSAAMQIGSARETYNGGATKTNEGTMNSNACWISSADRTRDRIRSREDGMKISAAPGSSREERRNKHRQTSGVSGSDNAKSSNFAILNRSAGHAITTNATGARRTSNTMSGCDPKNNPAVSGETIF